ncbi:hypothetical protein DENSPDRAFT_783742, partial [Dentipellis sp. KUC8613]
NAAELDDRIADLQGTLNRLPPGSRFTVLTDLGLTLKSRFASLGQLADLEESISNLQEAVQLLPLGHVDRLSALLNVSSALFARYKELRRLPDLTDPIAFLREALGLTPTSHPSRPTVLTLLAHVLCSRYQWGHYSGNDLLEALSCYREVLALHTAPHPERRQSLTYLALAIYTQFRTKNNNADHKSAVSQLDEAVALLRDATELSTSVEDQASSMSHLALCLKARSQCTESQVDLDEAVTLLEGATSLLPKQHIDRPFAMTNLVNILHARYAQTKHEDDLFRAITLHFETLSLSPRRHSGHSYAFTILEPVLRVRFQPNRPRPVLSLPNESPLELPPASTDCESTEQGRVDSKVQSLRDVLASASAERATALTDLALLIHKQCLQQMKSGEYPSEITETISLLQEALDLRPVPHIERPFSLLNLSLAWYTEYEAARFAPGMSFNLEQVEIMLREALELESEDHLLRGPTLDALAVALHARFRNGGKPLDLDEAILLNREALSLRTKAHSKRVETLIHLAQTLQSRGERSRQIPDFDEAVKLLKEAVTLPGKIAEEKKGAHRELALALRSRFDLTRKVSDLDEAIASFMDPLALYSDSEPDRCGVINDLAVTLRTRYKATYHLQDLDIAIDFQRKALAALPEYHLDTLALATGLADALSLRAEETGRLMDLDEAILLCQDTLLMYRHHHSRDNAVGCPMLETLGRALLSRFLRADDAGDDINDCSQAQEAFDSIEQSVSIPLSQRFIAVRMLARVSDAMDDGHGLGLQTYRATIKLLPLLAGVGMDLAARQRALMLDTNGLACEAASCAIRQRKYEAALEFIETGRGVFWSQALQLRTPVDHLQAVDPDLAQKLRDVSRALEAGALRDQAVHYRKLDVDLEELLDEIRQLDGFHDFMEPKRFSSLSEAAKHGPIVVLNASSFRSDCDALVLTDVNKAPMHVPLRSCSYKLAQQLVRQMRLLSGTSLPAVRGADRSGVPYEVAKGSDAMFRKVLGILWKAVVRPVLGALGMMKSGSPPRIWWLPTGPFTSLPLHAAGIFDGPDDQREFIGDYVVSSYIPTMNALLAPPESTSTTLKMLAVIQPNAPGQRPLKATEEELSRIEGRVSSSALQTFGVPGRPAHVKDVVAHLPTASIVHFACHGIQNPYNPLDSALLLEEQLKVTRLMELQIPHASLVFLSACQTAMGDERLPDEAIHLAATLLFAGYRSAVATLWSIQDEDGPTVADSFYEHLTRNREESTQGIPQVSRAAYALHAAVAKLRDDGCSFVRWIPFIHMGL